jgi:predicted dehydrogenase
MTDTTKKPASSDETPRPGGSKSPAEAPLLPYQPRDPAAYRPGIGLVGCGGITVEHLTAYRAAGYNVVALCDIDLRHAIQRQREFYPDAAVMEDYRHLLGRDDVEVVDIATHPPQRPAIVEAAIRAGKHVLSQKPFVLDLDVGRRLVDLADRHNVRLAVNQNGRWAPHFSYATQAIRQGRLGTVFGAHLGVHWDHTWVAGTEFENVRHLILYDFAIHWFDILMCFFDGRRPRQVFATLTRAPGQPVRPDLLAQAMIQWDDAHASLAFDAHTKYGAQDTTFVAGTQGTIRSQGPDLKVQRLTLSTAQGTSSPQLEGCWFPDGFHGTMAELLCAVEENREPSISAATNLESLALCFAAVASSERGEPVRPGDVRQMPSA